MVHITGCDSLATSFANIRSFLSEVLTLATHAIRPHVGGCTPRSCSDMTMTSHALAQAEALGSAGHRYLQYGIRDVSV